MGQDSSMAVSSRHRVFRYLLMPRFLLPAFPIPSIAGGPLASLISRLVTSPLFLHGSDGGIVEHLDGATLDCFAQFLFAERLAGFVEVGDIELIVHPQLVADEFLFATVDRIFLAQQFPDFLQFFL